MNWCQGGGFLNVGAQTGAIKLTMVGTVKKKIVPPKIFILGQNVSAIMLKIFVLP